MVLVEPLSSATSKFERPPEFSILLPATAMIFLQLEGIAAPYLGPCWYFSIPATSGIAAPHLDIHVCISGSQAQDGL